MNLEPSDTKTTSDGNATMSGFSDVFPFGFQVSEATQRGALEDEDLRVAAQAARTVRGPLTTCDWSELNHLEIRDAQSGFSCFYHAPVSAIFISFRTTLSTFANLKI